MLAFDEKKKKGSIEYSKGIEAPSIISLFLKNEFKSVFDIFLDIIRIMR